MVHVLGGSRLFWLKLELGLLSSSFVSVVCVLSSWVLDKSTSQKVALAIGCMDSHRSCIGLFRFIVKRPWNMAGSLGCRWAWFCQVVRNSTRINAWRRAPILFSLKPWRCLWTRFSGLYFWCLHMFGFVVHCGFALVAKSETLDQRARATFFYIEKSITPDPPPKRNLAN